MPSITAALGGANCCPALCLRCLGKQKNKQTNPLCFCLSKLHRSRPCSFIQYTQPLKIRRASGKLHLLELCKNKNIKILPFLLNGESLSKFYRLGSACRSQKAFESHRYMKGVLNMHVCMSILCMHTFFLMLSFYTLLMILFCLCYCYTLILLPAQAECEKGCPHPWTTDTQSSEYEVLNPDAPEYPLTLTTTGFPGSLCAFGLQDFHISQVSQSLQRLCPRTKSLPGSLLRQG